MTGGTPHEAPGAGLLPGTDAVPPAGFWPRSLFGRHLLLVVTLVVAGQLCAAWLARRLIVEPRIALAAEGAVRGVLALRAGLHALPPAQRAAFVDAFNAGARAQASGPTEGAEGAEEGHGAKGASGADDANGTDGANGVPGGDGGGGADGPADPGGPPARLAPLERRFLQMVTQRLQQAGSLDGVVDGGAPVWRREGRGALSLRVREGDADYWLHLPGLFPVRVFTGSWMAATLAGVLLALAGAWWLQRQIHRPLAQVVRAARGIAQGAPHTPLPEHGPLEIAAVAHSINHLAGALDDAQRERALMLAGISHDLRTPLTKLRLAVAIAQPALEPEIAASMARSMDEMDGIVSQFLDFARLGGQAAGATHAAHATDTLQPCRLDDLAEAVARAQADHGRAMALERGAAPPVPAHAAALRRAVDNLVENAWRHGRAPVTLRTGVAPGGTQVWIEVQDSGSGVPPESLARLRQPFVRGDAAARSGAPGAGLGLAIADRVARQHGGQLELHAQPGAGLRARIVLPLPQV